MQSTVQSTVQSTLQSTTTTTTTAAPTTTSLLASDLDRGDISSDFPVGTISVGDRTLFVALAETPELRSRGLMNVADLGDLDGMFFGFDDQAFQSFWMKDTLIPLDIAFFAADGSFVSKNTMVPCEADPCPYYISGDLAQFAIEVPAGGFDGLAATDLLTFAPPN